MRLWTLTFLATLLLGGCSAADPATACDRYAAPDGSDAAAGTRDAPVRTPQRLADRLDRGQVGCLEDGVYADANRDGLVLQLFTPGVTLRSVPGGRAHLRGSVAIERSAARVRLSGLSIVGLGRQNTVKVYARGVRLDGNEITNGGRGESCVILGNPAAGVAVRPVVVRNYLHDCGSRASGNKDHGIYASQVRGGRIARNLIVRPAAYAVQLYPNARGVDVRGNVIDGSGSVRGGIVFGSDGGSRSAHNRVSGNVIGQAATSAVASAWAAGVGAGNVASDNCAFGDGARFDASGVRLSGNVVARARFVDASGGDYRLAPGGGCGAAGVQSVLAGLRELGLSPARIAAARRRG